SVRLLEALRHRGPDDRGYGILGPDGRWYDETPQRQFAASGFCFLWGQTRLAIIDLSSAGHQPMYARDGKYGIVYNGEVYNYRELREELAADGFHFLGHSDTEVVLASYIKWREKCLDKFTGMFAFAIYDGVERLLFCARDPFGIKPFYYHLGPMGFCFASELPALLEFPLLERRVNPHAVYRYLRFNQYDAGGETFIAGISQLPPSHFLRVPFDAPTQATLERYWKPNLARKSTLSFNDAAQRLREMFLESVRLHLRSDVPVGVALSGGIDSSAITCAVRHLEPDAALHTFSFVAKDTPLSEERWAELVAKHTRAIRHIVAIDPRDLVADFDDMILRLNEPFGSSSIYAQRRVFRLVRECGIKVTLEGQGGDESLGGYFGYPGHRLATLVRAGKWREAWRFFWAASRGPDRSAWYVFQRFAYEMLPRWLLPLAFRCVGMSTAPAWLDVSLLRAAGVNMMVAEDKRDELLPCEDKMRQMLAYALIWYGLPALLRHGDRNSMAVSVESRVPFLTREMVEFCLSLPEKYLVDDNGTTKAVFRAAMRGLVPDEILERRDKIGFATPEHEWLSALSKWVEDIVANADGVPYLKKEEVARAWRRFRACGASCRRPRDLRQFLMWRLINYIR
ncbi:MAG: asparagine synthase (glutamine-hydrolyzing), partial [Planctomycetota bacterium]|nr:asparagine synthase (glutamine-hydrolyzing) [Planctomycetota bacterium]